MNSFWLSVNEFKLQNKYMSKMTFCINRIFGTFSVCVAGLLCSCSLSQLTELTKYQPFAVVIEEICKVGLI